MNTIRTCEHCHHQVFPKKWIRVTSFFSTLILMGFLYDTLDSTSGLFLLVCANFFNIILTKIYGYESIELTDEDYQKELERINKTDSQGLNRNKELTRHYIISISLVTFFFILPAILYRLNFIEIYQMFFVKGLSYPFACFFVFYILLYGFKDEWFYRITLNKIKFIPLMISVLLIGHILSLMFGLLVFEAYEIYIDYYFNYLLLLLMICLIIQLFIIKKTNLK